LILTPNLLLVGAEWLLDWMPSSAMVGETTGVRDLLDLMKGWVFAAPTPFL